MKDFVKAIGIFLTIALCGLILLTLIGTAVTASLGSIPETGAPNVPDVTISDSTAGDRAPENKATPSQKQALRAAKVYLESSGFSKKGLIKQLSSSYGDDFSKADATYAVTHVDVDWKAEAVESAELYLSMSGMSRTGLIKQLTSPYGDQYTKSEAEYAADKVNL